MIRLKQNRMRIAFSSLAAVLMMTPFAFAKPGDHRSHPHVVDPDTIDVGLPENLRIIGVDGPEKGWRAECQAERDLEVLGTAYAKEWLSNAKLVTPRPPVPTRTDRYGRYLGNLTVDGLDYAETMIAAGYLRRWDYDNCGRACKPNWCEG
jgi:endonuclease YncB( thermonuclease family)